MSAFGGAATEKPGIYRVVDDDPAAVAVRLATHRSGREGSAAA